LTTNADLFEEDKLYIMYFLCCIHQNYQAFSKDLEKLDLTSMWFRGYFTYGLKKSMKNENHDCGQILLKSFSYSVFPCHSSAAQIRIGRSNTQRMAWKETLQGEEDMQSD